MTRIVRVGYTVKLISKKRRKKGKGSATRNFLIANAKRTLRRDPTRTGTLRKLFIRELRKRFAKLKLAVVDLLLKEDALGLKGRKLPLSLNQRWTFKTNADKVAEFQKWLRTQIDRDVLLGAEQDVWEVYVRQGYLKGAGRSYQDFVQRRPELRDTLEDTVGFRAGTERGFLQATVSRPESVEKVKLLAGRAYDDLEGVTSEMSTRMVRHLTDGLVQGKGPREIARELADDVDGIGLGRATTIARTEIIRAHAEGQLQALEDLGVEEVGVMVEWRTAEDEGVCELCAPLEGVVLKIEEAHGMIPRHPNCRCALIPANVGEEKGEQQRGQKTVQKAIRTSQKRESGDDEEGWGPGASISKSRPRSVLNTVDRFSYLLNSFCPTGPGGGVDPTCSPSESTLSPNIDPLFDQDTIADRLRETITEVAGCSKDQCNVAAYALKIVYPEAEVHFGYYDGEAHSIAKLGDYYIDVTADQFGGDEVSIMSKLPKEYKNYSVEVPSGVRLPLSEVSKWDNGEEVLRTLREKLSVNAFCATGEGGGVDPSCSPAGTSLGLSIGDGGGEESASDTPIQRTSDRVNGIFLSIDLPSDDALLTNPAFDKAWSKVAGPADELYTSDLTKSEYLKHLADFRAGVEEVKPLLESYTFPSHYEKQDIEYFEKKRELALKKLQKAYELASKFKS